MPASRSTFEVVGDGRLAEVEQRHELAHADLAGVLAQHVDELKANGIGDRLRQHRHALGLLALDVRVDDGLAAALAGGALLLWRELHGSRGHGRQSSGYFDKHLSMRYSTACDRSPSIEAEETSLMAELTETDIREKVRERYAAAATAVAESTGSGCCGRPFRPRSLGLRIGPTQTSRRRDKDGNEVFGVAPLRRRGRTPRRRRPSRHPSAAASDRRRRAPDGEAVLDLGSGAGADVIISARRVAPARAIGLDMTDEMLELARTNAAAVALTNVEFLKGFIEDIPLPDAPVDVVISNCVSTSPATSRRCSPSRSRLRPAGASRSPT